MFELSHFGRNEETVTLLKFSTLQPLHRIAGVEAGIQGLCFGGDGQQLLGIRGSRCRVWGPTVLLRQNAHSGPSSNAITSVDASGRVIVQKLSSQGRAIVASKVLFDYRVDAAVSQVVCRPDLDRILICSTKSDSLCCLSQEASNPIASKSTQQQGLRGWVSHPLNRASLLLITQTAAYSFDWQDLRPLVPEAGIVLDSGMSLSIVSRSIVPMLGGKSLAIMYSETGHPLSQTKLVIWSTADLGPE